MKYFSSDFHGYHKNICRGVSLWEKSNEGKNTRDFDTIEEMNYAILKSINDTVGAEDELYFLGDFSFGGLENIKKFRNQINCPTIHWIFGNHDHHGKKNRTFEDGTKVQDLFTSCQDYLEFSYKTGHKFVLSHYSFRVWNGCHDGSIQLYGHSHGSLPDSGLRQIDVGWDVFHKPISIREVIEIMDKRPYNTQDHHKE